MSHHNYKESYTHSFSAHTQFLFINSLIHPPKTIRRGPGDKEEYRGMLFALRKRRPESVNKTHFESDCRL